MAEMERTIEEQMNRQFKKLPPAVQNAITSADVEKHLRELADKHKLHLDQWTLLENEVMLTLLGIEPVADLAKNIQKEVGADAATAAAIASDVSQIVFAPIRGELERLLGHPQAEAEAATQVEQLRAQVLGEGKPEYPAPVPMVMPATPPPAPSAQKVERAPASTAYASQASHERKSVEGDPYREQLA